MQTREASNKLLARIRYTIIFFMVALALSGITAFPLETEMKWLLGFKDSMPAGLAAFLSNVY